MRLHNSRARDVTARAYRTGNDSRATMAPIWILRIQCIIPNHGYQSMIMTLSRQSLQSVRLKLLFFFKFLARNSTSQHKCGKSTLCVAYHAQCSLRLPCTVLFPVIPALLIRTSTLLKLFLIHFKRATISSSLETSAFTAYSVPLNPFKLLFISCPMIVEFYCGVHIQIGSGQEILATKRGMTRQWRTVTD